MDFISQIDEIMGSKTCIVGMGNYYKTDDAVGLYIVDRRKEAVESETLTVLNVEDVIESYVFKIAGMDCDNVIIVDAVQAEGERGSVIFGRINDMGMFEGMFSTHKLSLSISGKILEENNKSTYLLGIIADDIDFGIGLSDDVKKSADTVTDLLLKSINCSQKGVYQ